MPQEPSFHMTSEEFRRNSSLVVDWIARYMDEVETHPVRSRAVPGQIRSLLPRSAPQKGESFEAILRDLDEIMAGRIDLAFRCWKLVPALPGQGA